MASMSASGKRGLDITPNKRTGVNKTGAQRIRGDLVMFDDQQTHADTTNANKARDGSCKVNFILAETAQLGWGRFAIVLETIADGDEGQIAVQGDNLPISLVSASAVGEPIVGANGVATGDANVGAVTGQKVLGIVQVLTSGAAVGTCDFDGLNGFGSLAVT